MLDAELGAVREAPGADAYRAARVLELHEGEARVAALRNQAVQLGTAIEAGGRRLEALRGGYLDDPRSHLRHASEPEPPAETQRRRLAEAWAALSVGLLVIALAVIVWFRVMSPVLAILVLFGAYLGIEAFFRRDIRTLVLRFSMALALITFVILGVTFLRELLLAGLLALGLLLIVDNLGELRRRGT
jgi:hypothetical protein